MMRLNIKRFSEFSLTPLPTDYRKSEDCTASNILTIKKHWFSVHNVRASHSAQCADNQSAFRYHTHLSINWLPRKWKLWEKPHVDNFKTFWWLCSRVLRDHSELLANLNHQDLTSLQSIQQALRLCRKQSSRILNGTKVNRDQGRFIHSCMLRLALKVCGNDCGHPRSTLQLSMQNYHDQLDLIG